MPATMNLGESVLGLRTEGMTPLRPAINFVSKHLHEKISLVTVAHLCGMGSCEFSRAFRRTQGMTFRDYLNQVRVNEAAALLKNSRTSVLDVACAVGFNDPSHFARMFRRYIGHTPTAYRRKKTPIYAASAVPLETSAGPIGDARPGLIPAPGG